MVLSAFPYSCLLLGMCNAYAETGLFVLMYLTCSRCRIPTDLPLWSTYELLHVLHFNLYRVRQKYMTIWQHSYEWNRWSGEFVHERPSSETQSISVAMERWSVEQWAFAVETYC